MNQPLRLINARVLTMRPAGDDPLGVLPRATVEIAGSMIRAVEPGDPAPGFVGRTIDARGRVLMPAFVDAHTHALWAGDRLDEWELKRRGVAYLDILKSGGGIMSTVRAVRAATLEQLVQSLVDRLETMLREGTTAVEVKSGYGLSTADELKMLRAIHEAAARVAPRGMTVVATALLGHALDPDVPAQRFIQMTIDQTLPAVHEEFPGLCVDAYCEQGAWPLDACIRLFERAAALGHPFRVHTDQFNQLGCTQWAVAHGCRSVDHLEASDRQTLESVARSESFVVVLPCAGFHTDGRYADARTLIDSAPTAAERVVVATNCNPGSAPCSNMPMAVALAVRFNRLTPAEAIAATTRNPARLLGLDGRGAVVPGSRADLVLLRHRDERLLAYEFGGTPLDLVIAAGTPFDELS